MIAIFLGSGGKGRNVEILSKELLSNFSGVLGLVNAPTSLLKKQKGIGKAKLATLFALREFSNRIKFNNLVKNEKPSKESIIELLQLKVLKEVRECFYLVTLDSDKNLINLELVARGGLEEVGVHTRDIVKHILDDTATFAYIAHNHPRQSCEPSRSDYLLFHQLKNLLSQMEVNLLDQLVLGNDGVYSCSEKDYLLKF